MTNPAGVIGITVSILAALVATIAICCCVPMQVTETCQPLPISAQSSTQRNLNPYADSCVTIHPELKINLVDIVRKGEGCECHYWFSLVDKKASFGTKAYHIEISGFAKEHVSWKGNSVEMRDLYGQESWPIKKIYYSDLKGRTMFVITGPCPECLSYQAGDYRYEGGKLFFKMLYVDCDGTNSYSVAYDLARQEATLTDDSYSSSNNNCP